METIKQLNSMYITKIKKFNDNFFIAYDNNDLFTFLSKETLNPVYKDFQFKSYKIIKAGVLVENMDNLWSLLDKDSLLFKYENAWYSSWHDFNYYSFIVRNKENLSSLIQKSNGKPIFDNKWFSFWYDLNDDYFSVSDIHGNYFLISKETGDVISMQDEKCKKISYYNGVYFIEVENNLFFPALIINSEIKPLNKNICAEEEIKHIEDVFYSFRFHGSYTILNVETGQFAFDPKYCHDIKYGFEKFDKDYYKVYITSHIYTLVKKPGKSDIMIKPTFLQKSERIFLSNEIRSFGQNAFILKDFFDDSYHFITKANIENRLQNVKISNILPLNEDFALVNDKDGKKNLIKYSDCNIVLKNWYSVIDQYKLSSGMFIYLVQQPNDENCTILKKDGESITEILKVQRSNMILDLAKDCIIVLYEPGIIKKIQL